MTRTGRSRGWLVGANLLLLVAALPAVGRTEEPLAQRHRAVPAESRVKPAGHHQPAHPSRGSSGSPSDSSSSSDDDDDGDDAAARVAGACCAGFVGAMAEGGARDPSDVDHAGADYDDQDMVEPEGAPPHRPVSEPPSAQPAPAAAPPESPSAPAPFDAEAAKAALRKAAHEADEQCVTADEQLGDYEVRVTFGGNGRAANVALEPAPQSLRLARCAQAVFLRAEVPPFAGEEPTVKMSFPESGAEPEAAGSPPGAGLTK